MTLMLGAVLAGCTGSPPSVPGPGAGPPVSTDWTMYQHAPHHNAVFARAGFRQRWSFNTGAKINGGLALSGNTLLVDTFGKEVIALDARTGKVIWRQGAFKNILMSTPIVAQGLVFVGTGANDTLSLGLNPITHIQYHNKAVWGVPGGDEVVALTLRDGRPRWRYATLGEDMPSPVYYNGRIFFANGDWHAYALRADTGQEVWRREINGVSTMSSAIVANGHIVLGACADGIRKSSTIAMDPQDGRILWEAPYGHCDAAATFAQNEIFVPSVQPGRLKYVGRTVVAALDADSGRVLWVYHAPQDGVWTMLASDESAIAGMYDGGTYYQPAPLSNAIIAFDAGTGRTRWAFHTSGPVKMSPLVRHGHLYVGDTTGVFYDIASNTGRLIRATPFKKPFSTSPPIIAGQTMFLVNDQSVYAVPMNPD